MQTIQYLKPGNLAEALDWMERYAGKVKPYAGGTDLMVQLREGAKRLASTEYLLDLGGLSELRGIKVGEQIISIGCMVSHTEVNESADILRLAPFLSKACGTVGSPQIRNNGTVGGNICNGSPAADSLSPFVALNAKLVIASKNGQRTELVQNFYEGASKVKLADNEIAVRIEFERIDNYKTAFIKLGRRKALAISRMNAAAAVRLDEAGAIADVRLVPGCVFSTPMRVEKAEAFLLGKTPSPELFSECGKIVSAFMIECTGVRWSTEYKQPVVEALSQRALCEALGLESLQ